MTGTNPKKKGNRLLLNTLAQWAAVGRQAYGRYTRYATKHIQERDSAFAHYDSELSSAVAEHDRILHVGCGWDRSGATKKHTGRAQVVGIDVDADAVQQYHSEVWLADVARLPFQSASFDVACSEYVFEHLQDPAAAMSELGRVIRPGGQLIALTPSRWSYKSVAAALTPHAFHEWAASTLREDARDAEDVYETYYRMNTPSALEKLAQAHGFRIERVEMVSNGPTWFTRVAGLFELGRAYHALIEGSSRLAALRCAIVVRMRRTGPDKPREASYIRCRDCDESLSTAHEACSKCGHRYGTVGNALDAR